jgi:MFS family permease
MLNKIVHKVARRHHPWRAMQFDELAEVYTSMTLRSFGFGVIGIFVPIYLYKNGISLEAIFLFYGAFFILRVPMSVVTAYIVGRIGPKHTIAVSTVFVVAFFGMLLTYDTYTWPLWTLAFVFSMANTLFFIGYNVDFSKIKHAKHGGKELGWLYIFERAGAALGPLVGGLLAGFTEPEIAIAFAMTVLVASLVPLFMTNEPVKVHQKISFKKFKLQPNVRDFVALSVFNLSYRMPLVKGVYDKAGIIESQRIVYTVAYEIFAAIAKSMVCFAIAIGCIFYDPVTVMRVSFIVVGLLSPLMLLQRFPALQAQK